jgi:iron complex transport system substrate-binding protein
MRTGEPLYHVDAEVIRRLDPDVLITQVHCDVCAVTPGDVARAGCATRTAQVVALSAGTVAGIYQDIQNVARALGRESAGRDLVADMQRRIDTLTTAVANEPRPSVVVIEWTDPVFTAANWMPELIEAAGGDPIAMRHGEHSATLPWRQIVEADPGFLIVAPCGFDLDRSTREAAVLEQRPGWFELTAVQHGRVAFADGNKYFNRSGTTIVETVQILAEILHPGRARPRWDGEAWRQYRPSPSISRR